MKKTFLFFGPEATVWSFISTHILLAKLCESRENMPLMVRCTGQLFRCQGLNAIGYPLEQTEKGKAEMCAGCITHMNALLKQYALRSVDMANFVDTATLRAVRKEAFSIKHYDSTIEYMATPVGKLALADLFFDKISDFTTMSPTQLLRCRYSLADAMLTTAFMKKLMKRTQLSSVVVYNPYTSYETARYVAHQAGVPSSVATHYTSCGIDWQRPSILGTFRDEELFDHILVNWQKVRDVPLSREDVFDSIGDSIYRTLGRNTIVQVFSKPSYADPAEIFTKLSLDANKKILVAGTSSFDERSATDARLTLWGCRKPHDIMGIQVEWGQTLLKMMASLPDLQLVIRVHPRDCGTAHHELLKSSWTNIPPNCRIVWPEDAISTYGLLELADVVLTAWSTVGMEAARLGVPAVQATSHYNFPDDVFLRNVKKPEEYQNCILSRLTAPPSLETFKYALRFDIWNRKGSTFDLGEFCDFTSNGFAKDFPLPYEKAPLVQSLLEGKLTVSEYNVQLKLTNPVPILAKETTAVQEGIALYLALLYFGGLGESCKTVVYANSLTHLRSLQKYIQDTPNTLGLCFDGKKTVAFFQGKVTQRTSAMAVRLAVMTGTPFTG